MRARPHPQSGARQTSRQRKAIGEAGASPYPQNTSQITANATITAAVLIASTRLALWPVTPARASVAVSTAPCASVDTFAPAAGGYSGALSRFQFASAVTCRAMGPLLPGWVRGDNAGLPGPVPRPARMEPGFGGAFSGKKSPRSDFGRNV